MMLQRNVLRGRNNFPCGVCTYQDLVNGITPFIAMTRVDFIRPEYGSLAPVGQIVPNIAVPDTCCACLPGAFDLLAPARCKKLVEIGTHADIAVFRNKCEGTISCGINTPWMDFLFGDVHAETG